MTGHTFFEIIKNPSEIRQIWSFLKKQTQMEFVLISLQSESNVISLKTDLWVCESLTDTQARFYYRRKIPPLNGEFKGYFGWERGLIFFKALLDESFITILTPIYRVQRRSAFRVTIPEKMVFPIGVHETFEAEKPLYKVRIHDLSATGMAFKKKPDWEVIVGQKIAIQFLFEPVTHLRINAVIRRIFGQDQLYLGVEFVDCSDQQAKDLQFLAYWLWGQVQLRHSSVS